MIVLRCTAKLLKRLRQPAKLPEPKPPANPLGEWYADIDFIDREPFVLLLNVTTGAGLVLPGRADALRALPTNAVHQLNVIFRHYGIDGALPGPAAELAAWSSFPTLATTRDRSVLASMNQFKYAAWQHFAFQNRSLPTAAANQWEGFYRHPSFAKPGRKYGSHDWKRPLDLVVQRLIPGAFVLELSRSLVDVVAPESTSPKTP
ncbi:DUF6933 domain-containing protein [Silanimonas sp.]|jgi:hypothetical protein|uniref:DUF6933 domain-containing protein n=1 Tax=Silanimonas sp. TaxID=1929290 RepID=UPI0037C78B24